MKLFKNGNILINDEFSRMDFCVVDGVFHKIDESISLDYENVDVFDLEGKNVISGLIDIHTHGSFGVDFNNANCEDILKVCNYYNSQGVTSVLPTILTDTKETTIYCINEILKAKEICNTVLGIHLEGPFLSPNYKGAMPEELLLNPDIELFMEYQKVAKNNVLLMTISPELEGSYEFVEKISKLGVICSIGHSGANQDTVFKFIESGASNATHLGNAMKQPTQHNLNVCGSILLSDIYAEIICDGLHVNSKVIEFWFKVKGHEKMIAVTDSIMATGLPDGYYKLGVNDIEVVNGDAKIKGTDIRAGSTLSAINAVKNISKFLSIPFGSAIKFMTVNPAKSLKIFDKYGSIAEGKFANFVVLDKNYDILDTYVKGECVYSKN